MLEAVLLDRSEGVVDDVPIVTTPRPMTAKSPQKLGLVPSRGRTVGAVADRQEVREVAVMVVAEGDAETAW